MTLELSQKSSEDKNKSVYQWPENFLNKSSDLLCPECPDFEKIGMTACEGCSRRR